MELIPATRVIYPGRAKAGELLYVQRERKSILAFLAHHDAAQDEDRRRLIIALTAIDESARPAPSWSSVIGIWADGISLGEYIIELSTASDDIQPKALDRTIPNGAILVGEKSHLLKVFPAFYPEMESPKFYNLQTGLIADAPEVRFGVITRWSIRLANTDRLTPPLFNFSAKKSGS